MLRRRLRSFCIAFLSTCRSFFASPAAVAAAASAAAAAAASSAAFRSASSLVAFLARYFSCFLLSLQDTNSHC